ncbi:MAG: hypothetical protein C5B58_13675 [Acidobacteria bacterium]|nr:MAG: hypothetical protein C5B58_13675 [Acidobacteriota bacterium]
MSTKTGAYSDSGKNPLSESNIDNNGDRGDKAPSFPDYAGGRTAKKPSIDPGLKYSGDFGNSGYGGR